ncbi:MAG: dihydropteroate synthase, partial [Desulfobulbaceae bacterium]|nr:dihydropteroate synthase [Desulfobulbaceae bacterium]
MSSLAPIVCKEHTLRFEKTLIMGVLNITPDSFSDGGVFNTVDTAVAHGKKMVSDGADLIDIGGESSRPGSEPLSEKEELARILPVVTRLVDEVSIPISIDTYKPLVADICLKAGAHLINDITGLTIDINGPVPSSASATQVATSGCTKTYEYAWAPPHGAGDYSFFATAKEGTENTVVDFAYKSFSLCPLTVVATETTQPSCTYPSGGVVTLDITNGGGPYTWSYTGTASGSGSGIEITDLAPGTYNITVTSAGGCTGTATITVNPPTPPVVSLVIDPAGCLGNDGSITTSVSGGFGNNNYTYFWTDNGAGTPNRTGLVPDEYTVIVTDLDNGCTDQESGTIIQTNVITASGFVKHIPLKST